MMEMTARLHRCDFLNLSARDHRGRLRVSGLCQRIESHLGIPIGNVHISSWFGLSLIW